MKRTLFHDAPVLSLSTVMYSSTVGPSDTHSSYPRRDPIPGRRSFPRGLNRTGMHHRPTPTLPRQSGQRADRLLSELLDRAPRIRDLVKGPSETHGRREHVHTTLPLMGSQFKQNSTLNVKPLGPTPPKIPAVRYSGFALFTEEVTVHAANHRLIVFILAWAPVASHRDTAPPECEPL